MSSSQSTRADTARGPSNVYMWLALIVLLGVALRFYGLGDKVIWIDESLAWTMANLPLGTIWSREVALNGAHPPLYYTFQKFWLVFGDSEFAMRSLSALIGSASILAVFSLGKRIGGGATGLTAAFIFAIAPGQIWAAQEAKAYAFLILLTLLIARILISLFDAYDRQELDDRARVTQPSSNIRLWTAYVILAALLLYSHSSAVAFYVFVNAAASTFILSRLASAWGFLKSWILANLAVLFLCSYWILMVAQVASDRTGYSWLDSNLVFDFRALATTYLGASGLGISGWPQALFNVVPAIAGFIGLWAARTSRSVFLVAGTILIGGPVILWLLSFYMPIFLWRIVLWTTCGMFIVLMAHGVERLPGNGIRLIFLVVIGLSSMLGVALHHAHGDKRLAWNEASEYLQQHAEEGARVYFYPSSTKWSVHYYARDNASLNWNIAMLELPVDHYKLLSMDEEIPLAGLSNDASKHDQVWLVTVDDTPEVSDIQIELEKAGSLVGEKQWGHISVRNYQSQSSIRLNSDAPLSALAP